MNKIKKIYLAGAMGCYYKTDLHDYPAQWRLAAKEYIKDNYEWPIKVISPTDFFVIGENYHKTEKEVMRFDLGKVKESDVILVNLNDLDKSLGTSDEILYAYLLGKPIIGFLDSDDMSVIHPWKIEQIDRIETHKIGEEKCVMFKALDYIRYYYIDC